MAKEVSMCTVHRSGLSFITHDSLRAQKRMASTSSQTPQAQSPSSWFGKFLTIQILINATYYVHLQTGLERLRAPYESNCTEHWNETGYSEIYTELDYSLSVGLRNLILIRTRLFQHAMLQIGLSKILPSQGHRFGMRLLLPLLGPGEDQLLRHQVGPRPVRHQPELQLYPSQPHSNRLFLLHGDSRGVRQRR